MAKWILLCVLALSVVACGGSSTDQADQVVDVRGVVQFDGLEGGWWSIKADNGVIYTPFPLPDEFKFHGLKVQASMVILKDCISVYPGTYVRIAHIEGLYGPAGN